MHSDKIDFASCLLRGFFSSLIFNQLASVLSFEGWKSDERNVQGGTDRGKKP